MDIRVWTERDVGSFEKAKFSKVVVDPNNKHGYIMSSRYFVDNRKRTEVPSDSDIGMVHKVFS